MDQTFNELKQILKSLPQSDINKMLPTLDEMFRCRFSMREEGTTKEEYCDLLINEIIEQAKKSQLDGSINSKIRFGLDISDSILPGSAKPN